MIAFLENINNFLHINPSLSGHAFGFCSSESFEAYVYFLSPRSLVVL